MRVHQHKAGVKDQAISNNVGGNSSIIYLVVDADGNPIELIYAELSGDFPLGDSRQPTYKSLRPFDLVS